MILLSPADGRRAWGGSENRRPRPGVTFFRYRYYDPVTGRWPNRDPLGEAGLELAARNSSENVIYAEILPEGPNLYVVVANNPLTYVDDLGASAVGAVGGWIAGDVAIPDPTDAAWPKWAVYGLTITGAAIIDICFSRRSETCEVRCQIVRIGAENDVIGYTPYFPGAGPTRAAACKVAEKAARNSTAPGFRTRHCFPR
jgi:RHS repeat-associated protein